MSEQSSDRSVYDICGADFFVALVDAFYDGIETDQVLLPLYPEGAVTEGARHRRLREAERDTAGCRKSLTESHPPC